LIVLLDYLQTKAPDLPGPVLDACEKLDVPGLRQRAARERAQVDIVELMGK
jgi:hypothetical protein